MTDPLHLFQEHFLQPKNSHLWDPNDLLFNLRDGIYVIDADGKILYANPAFAQLAGYMGTESIIGKQISDLIDTKSNQELVIWYEDMIATGQLKDIVLDYRKPSGESTILEINPGLPFADGSIRGVVRDITDNRENELKLARFEEFYRTVVNMLPSAVTVAKLDGTIVEFNQRAIELFGACNLRKDHTTNIYDSIAPSEHHRLTDLFNQLMEHRLLINVELLLQKSDKTIFPGEVSIRIVPGIYDQQDVIVIISRDISHRKNLENDLRNMATTDHLTGLLNRRGFQIASKKILKQNKSNNLESILIFLDINGMKAINDRYGHSAGDWSLKMAAEVLKTNFGPSDALARWGGDEFLVLTASSNDTTIYEIIGKCNYQLKQMSNEEVSPFGLSFSIGMATLQDGHENDLQYLLDQADKMMYRNKRNGDSPTFEPMNQ